MSTDVSSIPLKQRLAAKGLDGLTLLVVPAILFLLALFIYPFLYGLVLSFEPKQGGMFANYAVVQGADKFMPIDLHIPGCPPRPEAVMYGFTKLQRKIQGNPDQGWRQRYNAVGTEEWARGSMVR